MSRSMNNGAVTENKGSKNLLAMAVEKSSKKNDNLVLEIKDNGPGMNPKALVDALTSFGNHKQSGLRGDFNLGEHGIGLKLNALRLGHSMLIITKTKGVMEYGCQT
jgi:sensor histidine kinase YesM